MCGFFFFYNAWRKMDDLSKRQARMKSVLTCGICKKLCKDVSIVEECCHRCKKIQIFVINLIFCVLFFIWVMLIYYVFLWFHGFEVQTFFVTFFLMFLFLIKRSYRNNLSIFVICDRYHQTYCVTIDLDGCCNFLGFL